MNLEAKNIIMKITVTRPVTTKDVVANLVGNLLTRAGGDVADKVYLILTEDTLYLEYKGHAAIGYGEETRAIDEILLKELNEFSVTVNNNEELIKIKLQEKELLFMRKNTREDNLALAMSKVIKEMKG